MNTNKTNLPEVDTRANTLKWIAALESGDYTQGRGLLQNTNKQYCCLGVLCDMCVSGLVLMMAAGVVATIEAHYSLGETLGVAGGELFAL